MRLQKGGAFYLGGGLTVFRNIEYFRMWMGTDYVNSAGGHVIRMWSLVTPDFEFETVQHEATNPFIS